MNYSCIIQDLKRYFIYFDKAELRMLQTANTPLKIILLHMNLTKTHLIIQKINIIPPLDFLCTESYLLQIFLIDHIGLLPPPLNVLKSVCKQHLSVFMKSKY
jgi:hypothetical protein